MSEIEFLTVCAGCSIFTDIWASENQSLRAGEGIAAPQSRENLQTFVRSEAGLWGGVGRGGGRFGPPPPPPPPPYKRL